MQAVKEQLIASDPRSSIWLSANAGTGKTHVLINRLLRLILDDNEPERIVCITYTTAAATEMQNRIIEYAQKWITCDDNEIVSYLKLIAGEEIHADTIMLTNLRDKLGKILDFPEKLKIQTIHSFCQSVLQNFPIEAGIPPFFSVMDDTEKNTIMEQALNLLFEGAYKKEHGHLELVEEMNQLLSIDSPHSVRSHLKEMVNKRTSIKKIYSKYGGRNSYLDHFKTELNLAEIRKELIVSEFIEKNAANLENLKNAYDTASPTHKIKKPLVEEFINSKDDRLIKQITSRGIINSTAMRDNIELQSLNTEFEKLVEEINSAEIFKTTKTYLTIFDYFLEIFNNIKKSKYLLDYDDLIYKTYQLFSEENNHLKDWILYKLDGGIDHILLDEAQDTNPEQWELIKSITKEFFSGADQEKGKNRTLFVVGDDKQSIYSFQGADFRVFDRLREYFKNTIISYDKTAFQEVPLNLSFRSCPAILNIVDEILKDEEVKNSVSINNTQEFQHKIFRKEFFGYFEINPLIGEKPQRNANKKISWQLPKHYPQDDEENNKQLLAKQVAEKIRNIIDEGRILPDTKAPAEPKDIMILLRKRSSIFSHLISELENLSVPASGLDRLVITNNIAIQDIISFAKFKLLPDDDLNLACLLKSPFFEFSEEDIFDICYKREEKSVFESLRHKSQKNDKYKKTVDSLLSILADKHNETPLKFFLDLLDTKNSRIKFINYYGSQINEIFDEFTNLAFNYENKYSANLQNFIFWLENNDNEIKRNSEAQKNEVRILTVHGSKGLQAPIVIIPDTTSGAVSKYKLINADDMIICRPSGDIKNNMTNKLTEILKKEQEAENKRLLYVAMTRAKDELYIFGDRSDKFESQDCWYNIIKNAAKNICEEVEEKLILTNKEYLSYIFSASEKNQEKLEKIKNNTVPEYLEKEITIQNKAKVIRPSENIEKKEKKYQKNIKNNKNIISKGTFIHKLLEILPKKNRNNWNNYIELISKNHELTKEEIKTYTQEALNILENKEFNFIFYGEKNQREVPICGLNDDGDLITGQIDCLIHRKNGDIIIIDYKTTELEAQDAEDAAKEHKKQLDAYKNLLERIYPDKKINKAILFTYINKLIYI